MPASPLLGQSTPSRRWFTATASQKPCGYEFRCVKPIKRIPRGIGPKRGHCRGACTTRRRQQQRDQIRRALKQAIEPVVRFQGPPPGITNRATSPISRWCTSTNSKASAFPQLLRQAPAVGECDRRDHIPGGRQPPLKPANPASTSTAAQSPAASARRHGPDRVRPSGGHRRRGRRRVGWAPAGSARGGRGGRCRSRCCRQLQGFCHPPPESIRALHGDLLSWPQGFGACRGGLSRCCQEHPRPIDPSRSAALRDAGLSRCGQRANRPGRQGR